MFSILLVDTNAFFSTTFASLLPHSGYRVEVAQDQTKAVAIHEANPFDLFLLGLPNAESANTVLKALPQVKVILLLPADEGSSTPFLDVPHSVPVFHKPYRTEEVLAAIYATLINEGVPNGTGWYTPQP